MLLFSVGLGRCLPLFSGVFGALCGGRIDCLRFPVVIVVGSNAVRTAVAHPGVSVQVWLSVSLCSGNVAMSA